MAEASRRPSRRLVGVGRDTTDRIHAAVRASVLEVGLRRTTLSDVARRAGVSRMSIYRRYPDVTALVREVMTAEFGGLLARSDARAARGTARSRLVHSIDAFVCELRVSALFLRVLLDEPELLIPYVTQRMGSTQRIGLAMIERGIVEGQADGSVRQGDVRAIAQAMLLIAQSFAQSADIAKDIGGQRVLDELVPVLDRALAP